MKTLQLKNKAYTAGLVIDATGKCIRAAPIIKWMIGKGERWIRQHCKQHAITVEEVETTNEGDSL
jgi:hypothetical protein